MVWITYDLAVVSTLADRIAVMYAGRIVEQGRADEVIARPLHPYTKGLIGLVPSQNQRGKRLAQVPRMTPSLLNLPGGCAFRTRCSYAGRACSEEPPVSHPVPGRQTRCFHPLLAEAASSAAPVQRTRSSRHRPVPSDL